MEDKGLSEFISFFGSLQQDANTIPLRFRARINNCGEVDFEFDAIELTKETSFILMLKDSNQFVSLKGKSEVGIELLTESLHFNSIGTSSNDACTFIQLKGNCSKAIFKRLLGETVLAPTLKIYMKGFQNFSQITATCDLGKVVLSGQSSIIDADAITGYIAIQSEAPVQTSDLLSWHKEANKLLEHVRRVMSFASATLLRVPVIEFFSNDILEITALSQSKQSSTSMRVFHFLDQQDIFEVAVRSFFKTPHEIKNLFFAIEWFSMDSTYSEVRLINAMTVLENLIASNLSEEDKLIRPKKQFESFRKSIRCLLRQAIKEWAESDTEREAILQEINEKMPDLNRKTLLKKLNILIERWSIPMHGIGEADILKAKKARDLIVHQGYYDHTRGEELWDHVTIIREVVVRIVLTTLGFEGRYISYVGGFHHEDFPPIIK